MVTLVDMTGLKQALEVSNSTNNISGISACTLLNLQGSKGFGEYLAIIVIEVNDCGNKNFHLTFNQFNCCF